MNLEKFFTPSSVAVVGASRTKGKVGYDILENIVSGKFKGEIVPINRNAQSILGLPCYASAKEYGKEIDLAVICLPRDFVIDAVQELVKAKVQALIIVSTGFREEGEEGSALEQRVIELCKRNSIRFLGPNCLGLINTESRLNASFAGSIPQVGGVSVFSQSGAICAAMLDKAKARHLGIAKVVSIGNKADINEIDLLASFAKDKQTKVIVGYLEDISTGKKFIKVAEEATLEKPVIILKSGTTEAGFKAAVSHTGVLTTSDTAYAAAFKRAGVVRADSFEALFDYATAFAMQPLPTGKNILIITNTGGAGTIAADAVELAGMDVATIEGNTISGLRDKQPRASTTENPVHVLGDADPGRYLAAIENGLRDDRVNAILIILAPQVMTYPAETALEIADFIDASKPVIATFMGGDDVMPDSKVLSAKGLPVFESPERAVAALRVMHQYSLWKKRPPRLVTRYKVNKRRVERIITRRQRTSQLQIGEVKGKDILHAYGFRIPQGALAASAEEAVEIAERIGYPVAMKIASANIIHKSDLGGVQLNLFDGDSVEDGFELMMMRTKRRAPHAVINGIYVEEMVAKGLEVIIGMNRDPQFGPMLMFGLGGIFVEVMKDVTFHLAPITAEEAVQMLKSTKSYAMLEGKRGQKGVDVHAIATGLQRISQLTTDFPQIMELDINPFIVGDIGTEPVVADTRITLCKC